MQTSSNIIAALLAASAFTIVFATHVNSAEPSASYGKAGASSSIVPRAAFFVGLGGSYNSASFENQSAYGIGTSFTPAYEDALGRPQASITGSAAGQTGLSLPNASGLAPSIQAGYFKHFSGSPWLWGARLSFSYPNIHSEKNLLIPQSGGFTQDNSAGEPIYTPFVGNYVAQGYRQKLVSQTSLVPFIGRSFEKSFLYFGVGPAVVQTKTEIDSLVGFADINGLTSSITGIGRGSSYSTSQFLWGATGTVGVTYFIDPNWFVDASYSYTATGTKTSSWGGTWSFDPIVSGARSGTNNGTSSGSVINQELKLSINYAF